MDTISSPAHQSSTVVELSSAAVESSTNAIISASAVGASSFDAVSDSQLLLLKLRKVAREEYDKLKQQRKLRRSDEVKVILMFDVLFCLWKIEIVTSQN